METENEMNWKWCVGHEGLYEVSDTGIVRSWLVPGLGTRIPGRIADTPRILRPSIVAGGYYTQHLPRGRRRYTAHLVIEAFVGLIPEGMQVDHINRDKSDNRLENLRVVEPWQNAGNRNSAHRSKPRASKYIGVIRTRSGRKHPWEARLTVSGKCHYLGTFATEEEAAIARDKAAQEHHGAYAVLNFPQTGTA